MKNLLQLHSADTGNVKFLKARRIFKTSTHFVLLNLEQFRSLLRPSFRVVRAWVIQTMNIYDSKYMRRLVSPPHIMKEQHAQYGSQNRDAHTCQQAFRSLWREWLNGNTSSTYWQVHHTRRARFFLHNTSLLMTDGSAPHKLVWPQVKQSCAGKLEGNTTHSTDGKKRKTILPEKSQPLYLRFLTSLRWIHNIN